MRSILPFTILCLLIAAPARAADDRAACAAATGDEAISACSRLLTQEKGHALAVAYRNRCAAWNDKRESDRALADCNEAIRVDPSYAAAYNERAAVWRNKRDQDHAVADHAQAIRLDPRNPAGYAGRCLALANKRDNDSALTDCNEAIRLDAKHAPAYAARCLAYVHKQAPERALNDCNEALRIDPGNALAYNVRGLAWAEKHDYDRAIGDYDEAIRHDAKYQAAYLNRATARRSKRDYDRAIADADQAIRLDAANSAAHNVRGLARFDKRDYDGAIADYNEAVRLEPKFAALYNNRGLAWAGKRDYDRAIADYGEAIRLNPRYAQAFNNRGWALKSKAEYDRAIADFAEAIKIDGKYAFAHNNRGVTLMDKRDYDRAVADFNEAIRLDPGYTAAFANRGLAYERKGDRERARAEFTAALALPQKYASGKWAHDTAKERLAALNPTKTAAAPAAQQPISRQMPPPAAGRAGQRLALVIGNAAYPDADPPLLQPGNDARLMADELKATGFEVEVVENLSKQQLQDAIGRFKKKVRPGMAALIYYSGFGIQSGRQNYMIPVNAQIWNERDVARDGVSIESVLSDMADNGMVKLVILDASRRNPYERRFRAAPAGLAPIVAPPNSLVIFAAGLGQVVNEGTGKNSLFVTELLKEFRTPVVSLEEVFSRARIGVSRATDAEQVPWVASSLMEAISFKPAEERRGGR